MMNPANAITVARILLIPVFIGLALYYGRSVAGGNPVEGYRLAAAAVFLVASLSDWLDGWVARRFNMQSRLGSMLDPIADKGLVLSALITLSLTTWSPDHQFPLWFPVLVISKDVLSFGGAWLIHYCVGRVIIRPHWTGKVSTVALMVALAWVMLRLTWLPTLVPVIVASVFVVASGIAYIVDCAVQIREGSSAPAPPA
ncbi:MAG: CDP-diacylglycerol--glycerol-3-phosphate 3-phosphatidyltransferase [Verrucomicrobiota bacterium]